MAKPCQNKIVRPEGEEFFLLAHKLEKKIKPAGQVINSKARGQRPRALEFITWPKGLIFFPA